MAELKINTTQNVKINFTAANIGERFAAFSIDMLIKVSYLFFLNLAFGTFENMDQWSQIGLSTLLGFPALFYTLVLELVFEGQTLGKYLLKIKVVKIDGYQAALSDYLVRWFFRIVDVYILGIGFFIIVFNLKSQRLGDIAAGTAVISLRDKVNISHTILEHLTQNYQPTYANVIKLSDNDARIIKENFKNAKKIKDYKTLIKLREKIKEVTDIKKQIGNDIDFIDTVLKDYNYYTQNM